MKEGIVSFAYKNFLGYKKESGKIVIDEDQTEIVRLIYRMFLKEGKTYSGIADYLEHKLVPNKGGVEGDVKYLSQDCEVDAMAFAFLMMKKFSIRRFVFV